MSKQAPKDKEETTELVASSGNMPTSIIGLSMDDLQQDAGSGLQNVTAADLATPMVMILQSNSPQVKRSDGKYITGAVDGMIYNNVTNSVVDGTAGIVVIPCSFEKRYVEWKPNRGGFVNSHAADTDLKDQVKIVTDAEGKQTPTLPNGNALIETNQHYCLILNADGSFEPVMIPMKSSDLKASRIWNSLQKKVVLTNSKGQMFTPASYAMTYKLTSKARTKDTYSWFSWGVEPAGPTPTKELYEKAKAFEKAVSSGAIKVKIEPEMAASSEPTAHEPEDDSIPF